MSAESHQTHDQRAHFSHLAPTAQALLDLYSLLSSPNESQLAGHMPVKTFLQFTESVGALGRRLAPRSPAHCRVGSIR